MNRDRIEGNWKQVKGRIREQWGKLTDSYLERIEGQYEILSGRLQEAYAISREEAEKRIEAWQDDAQAGAGVRRD